MLLSLLARDAGPCLSAADRVRLRTPPGTRFVDLTELASERVRQSGVAAGILLVQSLHTTAALTVNENEPLLLGDLEATFERVAPQAAGYAHDDLSRRGPLPADERANGAAHCRALMLSPSVVLQVEAGRLVLGRWQRLLFVELDPPREREITLLVLGLGATQP